MSGFGVGGQGRVHDSDRSHGGGWVCAVDHCLERRRVKAVLNIHSFPGSQASGNAPQHHLFQTSFFFAVALPRHTLLKLPSRAKKIYQFSSNFENCRQGFQHVMCQ